jgi:hypothetical protein
LAKDGNCRHQPDAALFGIVRVAPAPRRARFGGWLLLLTYFCAIPGLVPSVFAALAEAEGSHGVEVSVSAGDARVTLTHRAPPGILSHEAIHHHCLLAKMLARFAEPGDGNEGPDHLVKFTSGVTRLMEKGFVLLDAPETADIVAPEFVLVDEIALPAAGGAYSWPKGAPPRPPAEIVGLKSTQLLI